MSLQDHWCNNINKFPLEKYLQKGVGAGDKILIVGESPAARGWRISGKACYTPEGKLLPTGRNLNKLLAPFELSVEICGFTELSKCFVGKDRKLLEKCAEKCWLIFVKQLDLLKTELIIIMGVKTLEIFNKVSGLQLKTGEVSIARIGNKRYSILPIYHPSPISPYSHRKNILIMETQKEQLSRLLTYSSFTSSTAFS